MIACSMLELLENRSGVVHHTRVIQHAIMRYPEALALSLSLVPVVSLLVIIVVNLGLLTDQIVGEILILEWMINEGNSEENCHDATQRLDDPTDNTSLAYLQLRIDHIFVKDDIQFSKSIRTCLVTFVCSGRVVMHVQQERCKCSKIDVNQNLTILQYWAGLLRLWSISSPIAGGNWLQ